jgi:hypothetical protein
MLILYGVVGCTAFCAISCAYLCIRRAGSTLTSFLLRGGAAVVLLLTASQYGALLKADSLGVSEELLSCCVYGICGICLIYFVLMLFVCQHVQGCIAQCVLVTVVIVLGCVGLLLEFGGVVSPHVEHYSQFLINFILSWSPFSN